MLSTCPSVRSSVADILNIFLKRMRRFCCKWSHGGQLWGQLVKGQGHTTPKLNLETWRRHHSRPVRSRRLSSLLSFRCVCSAFNVKEWWWWWQLVYILYLTWLTTTSFGSSPVTNSKFTSYDNDDDDDDDHDNNYKIIGEEIFSAYIAGRRLLGSPITVMRRWSAMLGQRIYWIRPYTPQLHLFVNSEISRSYCLQDGPKTALF